MKNITLNSIKQAHKNIQPFIHRTPLLTSTLLNDLFENEIYLKCENFQKVGAFKMRGATHAILSLLESKTIKGVATHSSGNHAAALALAAKMNNLMATIIMPKTAPQIKLKAVKSYGAEIILCEPTLESRESELNAFVAKSGYDFIHPYNDYTIIEGQATVALEIIDEIPDIDIIMSPVGGGGLLSGTALTTKFMNSKIKVYGGEPLGANDASISFHLKKFVPQTQPNTIADGLKTSLGDKTYEIILSKVDDIFTATEDDILAMMRFVWERMKMIIEPSSAVPLAALLKQKKIKNKKIAIIISGGNVDLDPIFNSLTS